MHRSDAAMTIFSSVLRVEIAAYVARCLQPSQPPVLAPTVRTAHWTHDVAKPPSLNDCRLQASTHGVGN